MSHASASSAVSWTDLQNHWNGLWRLPQEMWDCVMEHLDHDVAALEACCLTCRAWWPIARKLLWADLSLLPYQARRQQPQLPPRLKSLLVEQPEIANLVRALSVALCIKELSWLTAFPNLRDLRLQPSFSGERQPAASLLDGLRFPRIMALSLTWNYYPTLALLEQLLACFPRLTNLDVNEPQAYSSDATILPRKPSLTLPHLRRLSFDCHTVIRAVPTLLHTAGTSLESVKIVASMHDPHVVLDISRNTRLVELEVDVTFVPTMDEWGNCLVAPLSRISAAHTSLRSIVLCLHRFSQPANSLREPGENLGRELSRILDELPHVTVTFVPMCGSAYLSDAEKMRSLLVHHLRRQIPDFTAYSTRLRFAWRLTSNDPRAGEALLRAHLCSNRLKRLTLAPATSSVITASDVYRTILSRKTLPNVVRALINMSNRK
ncbi:uncharacterized protein B0H18DRAFT_974364 [Fomitopsis serialis]|uniref:uncharacterized protein n=1 Tax=Fomitopsis serialis TaxID=139415 RepID=UPI0020077D9B|nr:uncharacterized protein B0H18DRAFT_974364 [Neoantrodia serialis]KAH9936550.1 hypothetical protein B0H18DRAFT_974364 [Neoantrodia serialis]